MKKPRDSQKHTLNKNTSKVKLLKLKAPKEKSSKVKVLAVKIVKEKTPKEKLPTENTQAEKKPNQPQKDKTGLVNGDVICKSIAGLRKLAEIQKAKKGLFDDESIIFLQINCVKIPSKPQYLSYVLPYSNVHSDAEVCLVPKDLKKGKKADHEPTVEHWQELLEKEGVTKVKVLPLRQLRVEYDQFELQRRLLTLYDTLLVDTRICSYVLQLLGKMKNTRHNIVRPVRLDKGDIKKRIDDALLKSYFHVNEGPTSTLVIGHCGLKDEQLKENLEAVLKQLDDKFPGGHNNIRSLEVKLPISIAIPIYLTLKSKSSVKRPKVKITRPGEYVDVEGELSTMANSTVRITPRGDIIVNKGKSEIEIEEDEEEFDSSSDTEPEPKKAKKVQDEDIEPQPKILKQEKKKSLTKLENKKKVQNRVIKDNESGSTNSDVDKENESLDETNEEDDESEPAHESSEEDEVETKKSVKVGNKGKVNGHSMGAVAKGKIVKKKGRTKK